MNTYVYDGTFEGFLTAAFAAWRDEAPAFAVGGATAPLLGQAVRVEADAERAGRLRRGVVREGGAETFERLRFAFLSETPGLDVLLFRYLKVLFAAGREAADNPLEAVGPAVAQAARRTGREVHRMHAFVRFAEQAGGGYRAVVEPACDVLPLLGAHFAERFATLRWQIVDARRGYALLHDAGRLVLVGAPRAGTREAAGEGAWQQLWRAYYHAVDIPARRNLALRARHLPRRYWKHLPELAGEDAPPPSGATVR